MHAAVCFIVPTLRRPEFLRRCLTSILNQSMPPARILVGVKPDDEASQAALHEYASHALVREVEAKGIGVIGSMSSCLAETTEEFVVLLDDDVELPSHWLDVMLSHLRQHPDVLAVAGRDFLQDHPEMRRTEKRVQDVGRFHWYGRITGNHHKGGGVARRVDLLRGSNCLFRGDFLREVGFESRLRGAGAQVNWELALALQAQRRGCSFFYDPAVEVIHHGAPRQDADQMHRGGFHAGALRDMVYNEAYVVGRYGSWPLQTASILWSFLVGGGFTAGLLKVLHSLGRREAHLKERVVACFAGRWEGARDAFLARRSAQREITRR